MREEQIRKMVRKGYGEIAKQESSCGCGCGCGSSTNVSQQVGYSEKELNSVPKGADLNLGCGNPVALASLRPGETVVDLGSGGGLDCFLAAKKVGGKGKVIGVDMTPEMLDRARTNLRSSKHRNIEFRLGEIENLPIADNFADVIISNCVINLSPNKQRVFDEAFRVLKPKGRLMISDMVLLREIPDVILTSSAAYIACIAGAEEKSRYLKLIEKAGFKNIIIIEETKILVEALVNEETVEQIRKKLNITMEQAAEYLGSVVSLKISAIKP